MLRNYRWDKETAMSSDGFAGASATNLIKVSKCILRWSW